MKIQSRLILALIWTSVLALPALADVTTSVPVFRFTLSVEPNGADPARIGTSESNYFLFNVLRGLYFVDAEGVAKPELGECRWLKKGFKVSCEIKAKARWSDDVPVRAQDFIDSWKRLLASGTKGTGVAVLSSVRNARKIHKGESAPETLGVKRVSERKFEIDLESEDIEFIEKLAHPVLVATRTGVLYDRENLPKAAVTGPYRVAEWKSGGRIRLESNLKYNAIHPQLLKAKPRPPVEVLVIDDDETAFNLYREGTLTFLRRLPTHYLKTMRESKDSKYLSDLKQIPVARFDYLGFGPKLRDQLEFRQALASALNYEELRQIYSALGIPGCPGIEPQWMKDVPCLKFDLERAKALWAKVPDELKSRRLTLHFSKLGGDDIQKGMEWVQSQWKKHLGFNVELKAVEQGVYLQMLRQDAPELFRKGVALERSTCLAAVEIFTPGDSENFIGLDLPAYTNAVKKLRDSKTNEARKAACTEVVKVLVDRAEVIPLGRIHFSLLAKPEFKGWMLNPLNHLDLSHLEVVSSR